MRPNSSIISYDQFLTGRGEKIASFFLCRISYLVDVWHALWLVKLHHASIKLVHFGIRYFLCRYSMWSCLVQFTTGCSSNNTLRHLNRCQQMLLVHNERNTKTILRQWAEVGPEALEDSKVCNTTKTLVTYTLLYRISLFLICQFLVPWLYSSRIS